MGGHKSDSDSDDERKHSKHHEKDKHEKKDKHDKKDKHKGDDRYEYGHDGSGSMGGHMQAAPAGVMPGHENYKGKLRKEDVQDLKHRTDISDEEREHRRKILMAEVAGGVVGAGVLGFAGYQAYQHFNKNDDERALERKTE